MDSAETDFRRALEAYRQGEHALARELLEALDLARWPEAAILLAQIHLSDQIGGPDAARALSLLQQIAERGHTGAMLQLAELYYRGEHVARDVGRAVGWCLAADRREDARAAMLLQDWLTEQD